MLIEELTLTNVLSFGPDPKPFALRPLNLVIGPNGSGRSNLLEAVELLRQAPERFVTAIREGGGIRDWLWKGKGIWPPPATIDAVITNPKGAANLRYVLSFTETAQRVEILDERIENAVPYADDEKPYFSPIVQRSLRCLATALTPGSFHRSQNQSKRSQSRRYMSRCVGRAATARQELSTTKANTLSYFRRASTPKK